MLYCLYNTGEVITTHTTTDLNGGLLGGTYYNCTGSKIDNINVIYYSYNIGILSGTSNINQISPQYANCTGCYYLSGKTNLSGYGIAKASSLFKSSDTNSVLYLLEQATPGVWTIRSDMLLGNLFLAWQIS